MNTFYLITGNDAAGKRVSTTTSDYMLATTTDFGCVKGTVWAVSTRANGLQKKTILRKIPGTDPVLNSES